MTTKYNFKQGVNSLYDAMAMGHIGQMVALQEQIKVLDESKSNYNRQYEQLILDNHMYWDIAEFPKLANGREYESITLVVQDAKTGKLETYWTYDDSTRITVINGTDVSITDGYYGEPWPRYGDKVIGFFNVQFNEQGDD